MTATDKIKSILAQQDYKVDGGNIYRFSDLSGDWIRVDVLKGTIYLVKKGSVSEKFNWDDVKKAIDMVDTPYVKVVDPITYNEHSEPKSAVVVNKTKIRNTEIKKIRKKMADGKSSADIAKELQLPLHAVMYVVNQIQKGKKLRYEK